MSITEYQVNSRKLTAFTPLQQELAYELDKNYLFDLSYLAGIDVVGDRGKDFLQGQLSCDLRDVTLNQMRQGAMCNLKGRVLSLIDVIHWHGLHLILPDDLSTETQTSLTKTAMFSHVKLSRSSSFKLFGFHLRNRKDKIPFNLQLITEPYHVVTNETSCCYHIGDDFYIFLVDPKQAKTMCDPFIKTFQWRGSLAWHDLQLRQHHIEIYPESRGLFLPHRLGLHLSGHLNFNKGCYKGQEIIARTHYRAKLKHEMKLFTIQTNDPLQSGQKLFSEDGRVEMGELVDFCPLGDGNYLIATSMLFSHPKTLLMAGHKVVLRFNQRIQESSFATPHLYQ